MDNRQWQPVCQARQFPQSLSSAHVHLLCLVAEKLKHHLSNSSSNHRGASVTVPGEAAKNARERRIESFQPKGNVNKRAEKEEGKKGKRGLLILA